MSAIGPGDVVVCVDAKVRRAQTEVPADLIEGKHYRIEWAGEGLPGRQACLLVGVDPSPYLFFAADRFRKIDAPDTEIARRIRACKPIKTRERV